MKLKVVAGITNWNRCELLKENILAVLEQSYPVNIIHVVDNGSTDGSREMVKELQKKYNNIVLVECETNLGSAGGRKESLKFVYECGYDYCWILDDDSIPTKDCLKNLIENPLFSKKHIFLSKCLNPLGGMGNPVGHDGINLINEKEGWDKYLEQGIIRLEWATFCSCLVSRWLIERIGYPASEMNVWGEDTEYTNRVYSLPDSHIYYIGNSIVVHKRKLNSFNLYNEDNPVRVKNFYNMIRNSRWALQYYHERPFLIDCLIYFAKGFIYQPSKCLNKPYSWKKILLIWKGTLTGFFFNPKLEMVDGSRVDYWVKHKKVV